MEIDCCLYTGSCPFRYLPECDTPGSLLDRLGLKMGLFLPFPPLFYHRPESGLPPFRHLTHLDHRIKIHSPTNPTLRESPALSKNSGVSLLLIPGLHHYPLATPAVNELLAEAATEEKPIVLFRHLGDPRLAPDWLHVHPEPLEVVIDWVLNAPQSRIVLSHFFPHELDVILPAVAARPDLYVEIGTFSSREGWFYDILSRTDFTRWLYGSGAPLHYSLGNRLSLTAAAQEANFSLTRFDDNARHCYGL